MFRIGVQFQPRAEEWQAGQEVRPKWTGRWDYARRIAGFNSAACREPNVGQYVRQGPMIRVLRWGEAAGRQKNMKSGHHPMIKFSLPTKIHSLQQNALFAQFFNLCPDRPDASESFFAQTPSFFAQPSTFTRFLAAPSISGSSKFKCTGSDGRKGMYYLQLLSLSCKCERNRWQIITKARNHRLAEPRRHARTG